MADLMPGAEPFSAAGGPNGALVVHGFTGSPQSMRPLAEAFAAAGFTVELPVLPGHGTTVDDMLTTSWDDWSAAAERAYVDLADRCEKVVIAGLSMGGTLTAWLAADHPEVAGAIFVNAAVEPMGGDFATMLEGMASAGQAVMDALGNDIADPDVTELAYDQTPIAPLLSLLRAQEALAPTLGNITCPVLVMTSPQDHVVPPSAGDYLASQVSGPVERVTLERSYHVATLDYDKDLICEQAVAFASKVTAG